MKSGTGGQFDYGSSGRFGTEFHSVGERHRRRERTVLEYDDFRIVRYLRKKKIKRLVISLFGPYYRVRDIIRRNYAAFIGTSDNAYFYRDSAKDIGERTLVAAGVRRNLDSYTSENSTTYLFCANSADFFSNDLLGNTSYANYDVLASVISNISRTDRYATIELGGLSLNSPSFGGKQMASTTLSNTPSQVYSWDAKEVVKYNKGLSNTAITIYTVIIMCVPVVGLALGITVYIKRKYL